MSDIIFHLDTDLITGLIKGDKIDIIPFTDFPPTPPNDQSSPPRVRRANTISGVSIFGNPYHTIRKIIFRLYQYSDGDKKINDWLNNDQVANFDATIEQSYIKDGNTETETWNFTKGSFTVQPSFYKDEKTGNRIVEYTMEFRFSERTLTA